MYGKHFSTMYEGSMVGSGCHVFAVWGYCISNADPDSHTVRLNPKLLATILGESEKRIQDAIDFLSSPDPNSRCTDQEGRRLLNTSGMEYLVVSHAHYRDIKNGSDRREYMRKYMKDYRGKISVQKDDVNNKSLQSLQEFTPVSVYDSESGIQEGMQGEDLWKIEQVVKIAESPSVAVSKTMAQECFDHYASAGWLNQSGIPVGRTKNELASLLRKWKTRAPSFGKGKYQPPTEDEIRRKEQIMDAARRKEQEACRI